MSFYFKDMNNDEFAEDLKNISIDETDIDTSVD
jgi:hypothetical protein